MVESHALRGNGECLAIHYVVITCKALSSFPQASFIEVSGCRRSDMLKQEKLSCKENKNEMFQFKDFFIRPGA